MTNQQIIALARALESGDLGAAPQMLDALTEAGDRRNELRVLFWAELSPEIARLQATLDIHDAAARLREREEERGD